MFKYNIDDKIICDGIELNVYMREYYDITDARTNKIVGYNTYHLNDSNGNTYTISEKELMEFDKRSGNMFKYDVGDKVIYDNKECTVIVQEYAKEYANQKVIINEHRYYTVMDKNGNKYCCNEGDLRRMRRIDEIINNENVLDVLADIISDGCDNYCIYGYDVDCEGRDCKEGIKEYLNKPIKKPKVKSDDELIGVRKREGELKTPEEHLEDAIKEVNKNNEFMDIYKNIVNNMVDICERKQNDYGNSVQDTFERFGDISYLVRITDKYNRICSLMNKESEVKDESIEDTLLDCCNYILLWLVSRKLNK